MAIFVTATVVAGGCRLQFRKRYRDDSRRKLMLTEDAERAVRQWLGAFEEALSQPDDSSLKALFHVDSHWRDVLALSWTIDTVSSRDALLSEIRAGVQRARPVRFAIDPARTAPR